MFILMDVLSEQRKGRFTQCNHLTRLSRKSFMNLKSRLERIQPQLHFFIPFCVFFLQLLVVLLRLVPQKSQIIHFKNLLIANNLFWMAKIIILISYQILKTGETRQCICTSSCLPAIRNHPMFELLLVNYEDFFILYEKQ